MFLLRRDWLTPRKADLIRVSLGVWIGVRVIYVGIVLRGSGLQ